MNTKIGILIGVIILVIIIFVLYIIADRQPSPPIPPDVGCKTNQDCASGFACVNGKCFDTALSGLIIAAKNAASELYESLNKYYKSYTTYYLAVINGILEDLGWSSNTWFSYPIGLIENASNQHSGDFNKYITFLDATNCQTTLSLSCGYYAEIASISILSPTGNIIEIAGSAADIGNEIIFSSDTFTDMIYALEIFRTYLSIQCTIFKIQYTTCTPYINTLNNMISDLSNAQATINNQVQAVVKSGYALFSHTTS